MTDIHAPPTIQVGRAPKQGVVLEIALPRIADVLQSVHPAIGLIRGATCLRRAHCCPSRLLMAFVGPLPLLPVQPGRLPPEIGQRRRCSQGNKILRQALPVEVLAAVVIRLIAAPHPARSDSFVCSSMRLYMLVCILLCCCADSTAARVKPLRKLILLALQRLVPALLLACCAMLLTKHRLGLRLLQPCWLATWLTCSRKPGFDSRPAHTPSADARCAQPSRNCACSLARFQALPYSWLARSWPALAGLEGRHH